MILSAVDITSNSFTAVHIAEYYNNSNKPIERGKTESGPHKYSIAFYAESEILHLSWRIGTGELSNARRARQKFDTEIESLAGTRLSPSLDLRRTGSTNVVTHWSPSSETFLLRDLPLRPPQAEKGATMPNLRRYHSISLKLTDEELQLLNTKHEASGLNKTDYLMQAIRNSEVRVYSIEESIAPIVHEIRKIGTNLNQLAYFSNIGQEYRVRAEIEAIRKTNDRLMGQLSDFLNDPKFSIKGSK